MKIVLVHNYYQQFGGEDVVFEQERRLLEDHGHQVICYTRDNRELDQATFAAKSRLVAQSLWSSSTYSEFCDLLKREQPEIVHVHNTLFLVSPSIFTACADMRIPVVHTIHNYRLLCPGTNLYRDGAPCEDCIGSNVWRGIHHGCYRESRFATAVVATMLTYNRYKGTWTDHVDMYITPSEFVRSKIIAGNLPAKKIVTKPHFVETSTGSRVGFGDYAVFAGRISADKGISTLLQAWETLPDIPLIIFGDSPEREHWERLALNRKIKAQFAGHVSRDEFFMALRHARMLIFPSELYETFGMGIIEAFSCGVPVIASRLGAMQELVTDGQTGLLFHAGDPADLAAQVRRLWNDHNLLERMSQAAHDEYLEKYTAASNYSQLLAIYERVVLPRGAQEECIAA